MGWCAEQRKDPDQTSVVDVVNFLQGKFQGGAQWSTLRVYVAAIGAFHPAFRHSPLGAEAEVKAFFKGVFRVRPPVKPVVPKWDLGVVLTALGQAPFEPAYSVSLSYGH